jgi:hypothetical protein
MGVRRAKAALRVVHVDTETLMQPVAKMDVFMGQPPRVECLWIGQTSFIHHGA